MGRPRKVSPFPVFTVKTLAFLEWGAPSDGEDLYDWQDDRCAYCGVRPQRGLVLDHDHQTGTTRGYLCQTCNLREARAMDPEWEAWRDGCNPAVMFDRSEMYISSWGRVPVIDPPPLTDEQMDRIRAALM